MALYTDITNGDTWPVNPDTGKYTVSYEFSTSLPGYYFNRNSYRDYYSDTDFYNSFRPVEGLAAAAALQAMSLWSNASSLEFVPSTDGSPDIFLGLFDFQSHRSYTDGWGYLPSNGLDGDDIWGDVHLDYDSASDVSAWARHIGKAIGLDYVTTSSGGLDDMSVTLMSDEGTFSGSLGSLDTEAIRFMYPEFASPAKLISFTDAAWNPADVLGDLKDYDGNTLGAEADWEFVGFLDVQGDGDSEMIMMNKTLARWATLGVGGDGMVNLGNHGEGGDTRVVGVYVDPLVTSGEVEQYSPFDSQTRFSNDLASGNIDTILGYGDFDGDGYQQIYAKTADGTAYLHGYMHADGNIRYANYQSEDQMRDYLEGF
ncbi:MAG: hypothetical protein ACPGYL_00635, partial [Rhodospirillaceae bacterium]